LSPSSYPILSSRHYSLPDPPTSSPLHSLVTSSSPSSVFFLLFLVFIYLIFSSPISASHSSRSSSSPRSAFCSFVFLFHLCLLIHTQFHLLPKLPCLLLYLLLAYSLSFPFVSFCCSR
jgi:hypothetical protein